MNQKMLPQRTMPAWLSSIQNSTDFLSRYQTQLDNAGCRSSASLTICKAELCRQPFPTRRWEQVS